MIKKQEDKNFLFTSVWNEITRDEMTLSVYHTKMLTSKHRRNSVLLDSHSKKVVVHE